MPECTCGPGNFVHSWSCPLANPVADIQEAKKKWVAHYENFWNPKPEPKQDIVFDIKRSAKTDEFYLVCRVCRARIELPNGEPGYDGPCLEAREHCEAVHPDMFDAGSEAEDEVWDA